MICNALSSAEFDGLIQGYQSLSFYFPAKQEQRFSAHTSFWIAIPLGDVIEAMHSPTSTQALFLDKPYVFASNFQSQPMYPCGNFRIFGIELTPAGLHSLLNGIPGEEIVNKILLLEDFFPASEVNELQEMLFLEKDFTKQVVYVENFIRRNHTMEKEKLQIPMFVSRELIKSNGLITMEMISKKAGISEQHIRRRFKHVAGVSPKFHGRILRFNAILNELSPNGTNWLNLVEKYGYFDQSHLIKDFNQFTGKSPAFFDHQAYELNISQLRK